ncbi:MAG: hypothetical protein CMF22_04975 [Idiomarinaceae bacterium]|nr:hypothetical protein [Idiomarinaceae bacterium]|tara:strand:- start:749 stop:1495 length:747 start_codon:yes stop_codon:yes gene_type:complete
MVSKFTALLLAISFFLPFSASAAAEEHYFTGQQPILADIKQAQQDAAAEDKLLMLVLGADWCHDSIALMDRFNEPSLQAELQQKFVMRAVDVGYLTQGFAVTEAYGQPTYYGTPTVMIIDPESGQVVNKSDWQYWTNAASHDAQTFANYFVHGTFSRPASATEWQKQVQTFEQHQAQRVRAGFQAVSPLLKTYIESNRGQAKAEFQALWSELAKFRNEVFATTVKLNQQSNASEFPDFALQSWEKVEQ